MSPEVKPGYKQTEAGVIPEAWEARPLLSVVRLANGQVDPTVEPYKSMPLIAPDHIESGTGTLLKIQTAEEQGAISGKYLFSSGDIIYSKIRPYLKKVVHVDFSGLCSADMYPMTPFPGVSENFVLPVLLGHKFSSYAETVSVRSGMPKINREELACFSIALPPTEEQERIGSAFSDMAALIRSLNQLIAKKRDIQQAAMQQLLTGQRRLPGFSGEWRMRRLGDIASIKTGSKNNQDKLEDGEYPFYVRSATIERINSYSHDCEAILVPGEGNIGNIFHYINGKFDVHQRVYAITQFADDVSGKYVHLYMSVRFGAHAMQNSVKATVDSLRLPTFQVFEVLLPPTKEEQAAIAEVLTNMNTELATLEARRDKAYQLKLGMMQELLTGRIRLV